MADTVRLRNTNPLGAVDLYLLGRGVLPLAAGEEFDIDIDTGNALLEQLGNYELVADATPDPAPAPEPAAAEPAPEG